MKCPFCNASDTKVIDSRPADDNSSIRRRRQCETCGKRFTTYEKLETMPLMFARCRDARLRSMGYRRAVIKNYVMIYRVAESKKTVYILRFFYGARDYEKLL